MTRLVATIKALRTRGISLLAANDKINPFNYSASRYTAQDALCCFTRAYVTGKGGPT